MIQNGLRKVASQTTEQILHTKGARFENVSARSAAHLARTASSAAKVAQTVAGRSPVSVRRGVPYGPN
eukprot:2442384-Prymnesium_polylepis.1